MAAGADQGQGRRPSVSGLVGAVLLVMLGLWAAVPVEVEGGADYHVRFQAAAMLAGGAGMGLVIWQMLAWATFTAEEVRLAVRWGVLCGAGSFAVFVGAVMTTAIWAGWPPWSAAWLMLTQGAMVGGMFGMAGAVWAPLISWARRGWRRRGKGAAADDDRKAKAA